VPSSDQWRTEDSWLLARNDIQRLPPHLLTGLQPIAETQAIPQVWRCLASRRRLYQRRFLCSFSAIRAFTSFFTRVAGRGLSTGKRMVPLDVS